MFSQKVVRHLFSGSIAAAIVAATLLSPLPAHARVFFSVSIAPPVLPVYDQPLCPGDGYLWTPGYWAFGDQGYFWVDGAWVEAPYEGALWTPGYWGYNQGAYLWNAGYWGNSVGYYGGIDYGFGYTGNGFQGGYWNSGNFFYNRGFSHLDNRRVRNTYSQPIQGYPPVHPGGRAFDPHPPSGAGHFDADRNKDRGDQSGNRYGDDRGSRTNDVRASQDNFANSAQGSRNTSVQFAATSTIHDNHIVATPNPRQSGYSPEVNQGFEGNQTTQGNSRELQGNSRELRNDQWIGNAHTQAAPQNVLNRPSSQSVQQIGVQQFHISQQQQSQVPQPAPNPQYRLPQRQESTQHSQLPQSDPMPQYRIPQQQPYNVTPRPMPQQSTAVRPSGSNFDRFQPRTVGQNAIPQSFTPPSQQQQQQHSSPSPSGFRGNQNDPRR